MKPLFILLLSSTVTLTVQSVQAQAQVAAVMSLAGNVQSDEQRAIPGAAVTVIHISSGARYAAAADAAGRFAITNLQAGGPYIMRIGGGGYQPQTLENIFLKQGKTATFTVTLSRADASDAKAQSKGQPGRSAKTSAPAAPAPTVTEALAPETVVGGPVLITTRTAPAPAPRWPRSAPAAPAAVAVTPAPTPASTPAGTPAPVTTSSEAATQGAVASAPASTPTSEAAPTPARAPRRYFSRRPAGSRVPDFIVPGHYDPKTGNYIYDTGEPTTLKLAGGTVIAGVGVNSTESNLHRFITDSQMQVDTIDLTRGWYNFDRVFFNTGKATLTLESVHQLRNIATIMQAYPHARIKLGGYTDSTGTYQVNKQLSEARARTAWASLVEMGVSPGRIEARGYGPRYSIAPNSSEEGRAMNRRLSVKVLKK